MVARLIAARAAMGAPTSARFKESSLIHYRYVRRSVQLSAAIFVAATVLIMPQHVNAQTPPIAACPTGLAISVVGPTAGDIVKSCGSARPADYAAAS